MHIWVNVECWKCWINKWPARSVWLRTGMDYYRGWEWNGKRRERGARWKSMKEINWRTMMIRMLIRMDGGISQGKAGRCWIKAGERMAIELFNWLLNSKQMCEADRSGGQSQRNPIHHHRELARSGAKKNGAASVNDLHVRKGMCLIDCSRNYCWPSIGTQTHQFHSNLKRNWQKEQTRSFLAKIATDSTLMQSKCRQMNVWIKSSPSSIHPHSSIVDPTHVMDVNNNKSISNNDALLKWHV